MQKKHQITGHPDSLDTKIRMAVYGLKGDWMVAQAEANDYTAAAEWMNGRLEGKKPAERIVLKD